MTYGNFSVSGPGNLPLRETTDEVKDIKNLGEFVVDGNKTYVLCKNGSTALDKGKLVQSSAPVANHLNLQVAAVAVGEYSVTVTLGATAATANQYAGGTLLVNDGTGEGDEYTIESHPAADASATVVVKLKESIRTALVASGTSEVSLIANKYSGVVIAPTTATSAVVAVPTVAVPANEYFWGQVRGLLPVLAQGATSAGIAVERSGSTAGAVVTTGANTTGQRIGVAHQAAVDTEYRLIDLCIA